MSINFHFGPPGDDDEDMAQAPAPPVRITYEPYILYTGGALSARCASTKKASVNSVVENTRGNNIKDIIDNYNKLDSGQEWYPAGTFPKSTQCNNSGKIKLNPSSPLTYDDPDAQGNKIKVFDRPDINLRGSKEHTEGNSDGNWIAGKLTTEGYKTFKRGKDIAELVYGEPPATDAAAALPVAPEVAAAPGPPWVSEKEEQYKQFFGIPEETIQIDGVEYIIKKYMINNFDRLKQLFKFFSEGEHDYPKWPKLSENTKQTIKLKVKDWAKQLNKKYVGMYGRKTETLSAVEDDLVQDSYKGGSGCPQIFSQVQEPKQDWIDENVLFPADYVVKAAEDLRYLRYVFCAEDSNGEIVCFMGGYIGNVFGNKEPNVSIELIFSNPNVKGIAKEMCDFFTGGIDANRKPKPLNMVTTGVRLHRRIKDIHLHSLNYILILKTVDAKKRSVDGKSARDDLAQEVCDSTGRWQKTIDSFSLNNFYQDRGFKNLSSCVDIEDNRIYYSSGGHGGTTNAYMSYCPE